MHRPILVLPAGAFNIQHVVLKASFRNAPLRRAVQRKCADSEITRARHGSSMAPKMGPRCHKIAPRWTPRWPQDWPKITPKMDARWTQDGPKMAPRLPQDAHQIAPR